MSRRCQGVRACRAAKACSPAGVAAAGKIHRCSQLAGQRVHLKPGFRKVGLEGQLLRTRYGETKGVRGILQLFQQRGGIIR